MTTMTVMPRGTDEWTVHDLDGLPEDGLQYELLDGILLVTPAPVPLHQRALGNLHLLLRAACPPELEVFLAPIDWQPDLRTSLQPDLLVVRRELVGVKNITRPLELAVEILSPSTHRKDTMLKASRYAEAGIGSFWVVDPGTVGDAGPTVTVHSLRDRSYVPTAHAARAETITTERPFTVTITPDELVH